MRGKGGGQVRGVVRAASRANTVHKECVLFSWEMHAILKGEGKCVAACR